MTTAFIWDLDGTLLDSYDAILAGIEETYAHYGLDFDREGIHSYILKHSVQKLLEKVASEKGLDAAEMNAFRGASLKEKNAQVHLMEGAAEILAWAEEQGIAQFVYTHKGLNAHQSWKTWVFMTILQKSSQQPTALSASPTQKVLTI